MKKSMLIFLISIFVILALAGVNPVKADDLISSDIITVTPALSPTELKEKVTTSFLIEYLRQGGSIDLSNKSAEYNSTDLIDEFANLLEELDIEFNPYGQSFDTSTRTNLNKYTTSTRNFINLLPSLQTENTSPSPTPPIDYSSQVYNITHSFFGDHNYFDYPFKITNANGKEVTDLTTDISFFTDADFTINNYYNLYASSGIATLNIDTTGSNIDLILNGFTGNPWSYLFNGSPTVGNYAPYFHYINVNGGQWDNNNYGLGISSTFNFTHNFNSLSDCITYCEKHFRNCNIYVDGVIWGYVSEPNYYVGLGQGTFIEGTNTPVEYNYQIDIYIDYDDIIDRLDTLIENQNKITFPDFSDLIVDANGQPAFAIVDVTPQDNIDDWYVKNYGTLIPLFPVYVTYPVSVNDIANVATIGIVDVIPNDIIEIFGIALIGMLFVTFIHRLLE